LADDRFGIELLWLQSQAEPLVVEVQAEAVLFFGPGVLAVLNLLEIKVLADPVEELLVSQAIQRLENSIVVLNPQIVRGVADCHKVIESLFSRDFPTLGNRSVSSHFTHIVSGCCSVVAVSHVKGTNFCELLRKVDSLVLGELPEHVADPVITGYITVRSRRRDDIVNAGFDDLLVLFEGQEDRSDIRTLNIGQLGSVEFLLGQSVLMPFYPILLVVLDAGQAHDATLGVAIHGLLVDVHRVVLVLDQVSLFDEVLQGISALLVYLVAVGVHVLGQVNLRLVHV
jgi:hypothetical protein